MINKKNNTSKDTNEIKTLIIITLIIIVVSVGLYFLTDKNLSKNNTGEIPDATISYSEILIGTMFSRPYEEYYVFIYSNEDKEVNKLDDLFTKYDEKEEAKKIYYVDLDNEFNKYVISDKSNQKPANPAEVKIKDRALVLIKDGKVSKYYETVKEIEKALS